MKIKTPTEFQVFTSGRMDVWSVAGNKLDRELLHGIPFGDRTVTDKRYYTARSASQTTDRLIQTPHRPELATGQNVIIGRERYKVERVQPVLDACPPLTVLTLKRVGVIPDG